MTDWLTDGIMDFFVSRLYPDFFFILFHRLKKKKKKKNHFIHFFHNSPFTFHTFFSQFFMALFLHFFQTFPTLFTHFSCFSLFYGLLFIVSHTLSPSSDSTLTVLYCTVLYCEIKEKKRVLQIYYTTSSLPIS